MEGLDQLRYNKVAGMGYIGATPFVNDSINAFLGLKRYEEIKKDDSYEDAIKRENELHEKKMSRLTKAKSKRLELKRHIEALNRIDARFERFEQAPISKVTKEKKEKEVKEHLEIVRGGLPKEDKKERETSADIKMNSVIVHGKSQEVKSNADGSLFDKILDTTKSVLTPKVEESPKDTKIMGMPKAVFYSIVGLVALTIVVLIIKNRK